MQLPRFTVVGWSDQAAGGYGSGSGRRRSDGWGYQDAVGRILDVEVVPPDTDLAEEKQRAVVNMESPSSESFATAAEIQPPQVEQTPDEIRRAASR